MYLVLYCHNIGMTDFSFFETADFDEEEGYIVRGKWPNEQAFMLYLAKEFGDLSHHTVINLIKEGKSAEDYSQQDLIRIARDLH